MKFFKNKNPTISAFFLTAATCLAESNNTTSTGGAVTTHKADGSMFILFAIVMMCVLVCNRNTDPGNMNNHTCGRGLRRTW